MYVHCTYLRNSLLLEVCFPRHPDTLRDGDGEGETFITTQGHPTRQLSYPQVTNPEICPQNRTVQTLSRLLDEHRTIHVQAPLHQERLLSRFSCDAMLWDPIDDLFHPSTSSYQTRGFMWPRRLYQPILAASADLRTLLSNAIFEELVFHRPMFLDTETYVAGRIFSYSICPYVFLLVYASMLCVLSCPVIWNRAERAILLIDHADRKSVV